MSSMDMDREAQGHCQSAVGVLNVWEKAQGLGYAILIGCT